MIVVASTRQHGEPCRQRGGCRADGCGTGDRGLAIVRARAGDGSLPIGREIARHDAGHGRWGRLVKRVGCRGPMRRCRAQQATGRDAGVAVRSRHHGAFPSCGVGSYADEPGGRQAAVGPDATGSGLGLTGCARPSGASWPVGQVA
jgi:hypothetical protein